MTGPDIETAARALSIGWDPVNGGIIHEDVPTPACNVIACGGYASLGNDAGVTPGQVADALRALIDGDRSPIDALIQSAAVFRAQG